jgi:hypothetical protein
MLVVAVATIVLISFFDSESFQNCVCAQKQHNAANALREHNAIFPVQILVRCIGVALEDHNSAITAIASIIIAIFTATLWHATKGMLKASADQSDKMERSIAESAKAATAMENLATHFAENVTTVKDRTAKQLRAYLTVVIFDGIYQDREKNLRFEAKPMIINTGQTPAHNVGFRAKAAILPEKFPSDFAFPLPDEIVGAATLGPHQNFVINAAVEGFCDDADVGAIKVGKENALYIWGVVTYKDIFGDEWFTKFCHAVFFVAGKITGRYVSDYNEST